MTETIKWIGTPEACARLGVTLRTLYRFIDEGQLPAYKMGRVIRLQAHEVDAFIEKTRILPGTLEHLYPDPRGAQVSRSTAAGGDDAGAGGTGSGRPVARGRGGADKGGADKGGPGDESRASVAGDELAASPGEGL